VTLRPRRADHAYSEAIDIGRSLSRSPNKLLAVGNLRNQIVYWALIDAFTDTDWRLLMSLGTILLVILVIALLGGFSGLGGGPFYGTGYYGGGGLGLVLVIVLILVLLGRI
jgi:hypothetical protein